MDFITKLSKTACGFETIWVIRDRLTKIAHFIVIQESSPVKKLAYIHIKEVIVLHGEPVSIIYNRDVRFTSMF